jgi:hypothetical protein
VIIVMDIHQVIGERELDFEDTYRDVYVPAVSSTNDARLLLFGWLPHGGGEGYEAVTLTGVRGINAWDEFSERLRYGDLAEWATAVDAMRYGLDTTLHDVAEWSPLAELDLDLVPATAREERVPVLLRLDSIAPTGTLAELDDALGTAAANSDASLLELVGGWSSCFGDMAGDAVHVLYRVVDREALSKALEDQDSNAAWRGSLAASIGQAAERTRLLRAARWSPLA